MTADRGIEDPPRVQGNDIEKKRAFSSGARFLRNRIMASSACP
ncbi:MAG TPA: hypothetical protein VNS34_03445 [Rhizobiaceae bacterium]|nr:hypothetical protein [Rhizobiaceae bacterium]